MAWNFSAGLAFKKVKSEERIKRIIKVFIELQLSVDDVIAKKGGNIYDPFIEEFGLRKSERYRRSFTQFIYSNAEKIKVGIRKLRNPLALNSVESKTIICNHPHSVHEDTTVLGDHETIKEEQNGHGCSIPVYFTQTSADNELITEVIMIDVEEESHSTVEVRSEKPCGCKGW